MVSNPILPGFHPDPSLCKAGDTWYIATSTFEWYPGVEINASKNLSDWELVARPLDRAALLDMRGNPDNCGVWAPALSYADGLFWLIYTNVKRFDGSYKDAHNYLTTAPAITGPWSDPVRMNSSGFDPSLFHDEDGRKWFVNMQWDYRGAEGPHPGGHFAGILLQEYDHAKRTLVGPVTRIFEGSARGLTEAPHLLRHDGKYVLITAEGGTGYEHAVTHARADTITGPYELHPQTHVLTAADKPEAGLLRIGHGQPAGDSEGWWHSFLCGRPLPGLRRCPLGRETGITRAWWGADGWMYCDDPQDSLRPDGYTEECKEYRFDGTMDLDFQWLRTPETERIFSTTVRPGHLRLFGRESIGSWFEQALLARRQTGWRYSAETVLAFEPRDFQSQAGLAAYYNRHQFHYLFLSRDEAGNRALAIQSCPGLWPEGTIERPIGEGVPVPEGLLELGVDVDLDALQFRWRVPGSEWALIGPVLDASVLSDEGGRGEHSNFTGAFVGMAAQDASGQGLPADFATFRYWNRNAAG
ncbi:glycoside hydrolase family 43 protein [Tropicimonas sp. TH_r6]|uniref:glycoside hydrolase family 43 protein n=1 Tax=Tropicimonas sp. TH_r6 TaxID=3082085 RepID=UPI002954376E|nr:glycoside hydrolase family 43 protein [Tropicimonas sp. TH_r6]MDV7143127.1 glycoside hydrolase family 43 protein [Tropicimonas sp. TH_r6]